MVVAKLDVAGHQVRDRRIGAAKHHVLARALKIIVDDLEGSRAIPAADGLRVKSLDVRVAQIGVDDRGVGAVQGRAAEAILLRVAVNVHAIQDQVMGGNRESVLVRTPVAQVDQGRGVLHTRQHGDFQTDQAVVAGTEFCADCPFALGIDDLGHRMGVLGADSHRLFRKAGHVGRADSNPFAAPAFGRQDEIARVGCPGLQHDFVTRTGLVQCRLKIAARSNLDCVAGHRRRGHAGFEQYLGTCRGDWRSLRGGHNELHVSDMGADRDLHGDVDRADDVAIAEGHLGNFGRARLGADFQRAPPIVPDDATPDVHILHGPMVIGFIHPLEALEHNAVIERSDKTVADGDVAAVADVDAVGVVAL